MTIHLLGLALSPTQAVFLAALLGLVLGAAVTWLVMDYRSKQAEEGCYCDYTRGSYWCDEHRKEAH